MKNSVEKSSFWDIFKDKNDYNEKSIIGFLSFAVIVIFSAVDLVTGYFGKELLLNEYIFNAFVIITLGAFGIAGAEKIFKKDKPAKDDADLEG